VRTGEKLQIGILAVAIAINLVVVVILVIETGETNPLLYLGFGIPIAIMAWIAWGTVRKWRTRVRAREGGLKGKLRVLNASESFGGVVTVNQMPYLKLDLEIELPDRPRDRFSKRMVVPRLAVPAVMGGETFDVWVDPEDPRRFDVEW
jgi:hypothetical protein